MASRGNAMVSAESVRAMPQRLVPGSMPRIRTIADLESRRGDEHTIDCVAVAPSPQGQPRGTAATTTDECREVLDGALGVERVVARHDDRYFAIARAGQHHRSAAAALKVLGERA